jgi:galactose-1-phosphate uridylyltransferase
MTAYDPNNIFAKILRGEFSCHKVYEDEHVFAFLDIMPRVSGHTLVIPKAPARNILDIKPDDYAHVARGAHKIARGYLPQTTYSAHFIADPDLRRAIDEYLRRERAYVAEAARELTEAGPFRKAADQAP